MQGHRTGYSLIRKLAVLYIVVWSISPPLQIDLSYRLLALGAAGLWVIVALRDGIILERKHVLALIFAFSVAVIAYVEKGSLDGILQQIAIYILVVCFVINGFYRDDWEELRGIVPIVLILLTIFNYNTWQVLVEDPTIARKLVRSDASMNIYLRQGIGGYGLIYPQVCIFPAIMAWIIKAFRNNLGCFALGCIWLISYVFCILNAGYSIAIFATVTGVIMLLFYKGRSAISALLVISLIFLLSMIGIVYLDGTRNFLLEFFDGTAVAKKINDLVASAESGAAEGSIYSRVSAYENTFKTIFEYPFIGGLWMKSGGGHSALFDVFAKYGIFGGIVYAQMIYHVPNCYKLSKKHPLILSISNAVLTSLLFISILNSFSYSFMCVILIVLPLLYEDIIKWEAIDL